MLFLSLYLQETLAFNSSLLRPRVIGEWIGRAENDADPLAAEMLQRRFRGVRMTHGKVKTAAPVQQEGEDLLRESV